MSLPEIRQARRVRGGKPNPDAGGRSGPRVARFAGQMAFLARATVTACLLVAALPAAHGAGDDAMAGRAREILEAERQLARAEDPGVRRDVQRRIEKLERDARRQAREELKRDERQRERVRERVDGARDLRIFEGREVLRLPLERSREREAGGREVRGRGRDDREIDDGDGDDDGDDGDDLEDADEPDEEEEQQELEQEELEEEDREGSDDPAFD